MLTIELGHLPIVVPDGVPGVNGVIAVHHGVILAIPQSEQSGLHHVGQLRQQASREDGANIIKHLQKIPQSSWRVAIEQQHAHFNFMKQGVLQLNNDAHKKYDTSINRYLTSNSPGPILELIIPRMVSIGLPIKAACHQILTSLFRPQMEEYL